MTQQADISIMFSEINLIYLFLTALLTMRLLSEEKNKKTDQLLLSSPVSITGDSHVGHSPPRNDNKFG